MQQKRSLYGALSRDGDSFIAAVAGFLIIQLFCRHSGIGVSPDSVVYMSTAVNIVERRVISDFSGWPMMDFPAGYPFFLAALRLLTRLDTMRIGPFLDGILFGTIIYCSGWLMERFRDRSKWYKWAVLTIIILSPCLLEVYSMIWSETLFLLLIIFFVLTARPYFQRPVIGKLILPAFIAALACVTRYAGISLIMTGGLLILVIKDLPWGKKLLHGALFGLIGSSLFLLNLYRNHTVTGTLTGYREKALTTFSDNLHHYGSVLCDWLPFFNGNYEAASWVGAFFIVFSIVIFIRRWLRKEDIFSFESIGGAYYIVYSIFILAIASLSRFQQLDSRLLSPMFIPWIWASSSWIPERVRKFKAHSSAWRWMAAAGCAVIFICMQAGQWHTFQLNWEGIKYAGIPGYTEDQWQQSPTMEYIRRNADMHKPGAPVYSNAYEGIWFLTGVHSDLIPHKEFAQDIKEMLHEDHFYVIWFDDTPNSDIIPVEYIRKFKKLSREYRFDDGTVYFFTTK